MAEPTLLLFHDFQFFSPKRIHVLDSSFPRFKTGCHKSPFNHLLLLMNFCLTESHILTNVIECALHFPMLCCAYWNVYCAMVVWFCFFIAAVSVVFICEVLWVNVWFMAFIFSLDGWVRKQRGCKYFCVNCFLPVYWIQPVHPLIIEPFLELAFFVIMSKNLCF